MRREMNPSPAMQHRRQIIWQIWMPLGTSILAVLILAGFSVVGAFSHSDQIERWGNLSAVWVILPGLITLIIFLVIIIAGVYGMSKLLEHMPIWMLKLQSIFERVCSIASNAADRSTKPVMVVNGAQARVSTLWKKIFG